jgi:hypothetical protein
VFEAVLGWAGAALPIRDAVDAREKAHGLNPRDASDASADRDGDGYSNLEEYLNELARRPQTKR